MLRKSVWILTVVLCVTLAVDVSAQQTQTIADGQVILYTPGPATSSWTDEELASAVAMPMPQSPLRPQRPGAVESAAARTRTPGFVPGSAPPGGKVPSAYVPLLRASQAQPEPQLEGQPVPQEFGLTEHPFTTSRVDLSGNKPSHWYPYAPTGRLYFKIGGDSYVCSASLIKRGVIVTAAHCVVEFGGSFYSDWLFVPALSGTRGFSKWQGIGATARPAYINGTDSCAVPGVVCENDVALIILKGRRSNTVYPGDKTGWYGYGYDSYGFNSYDETQISQLGYPVSHDSGNYMQRTDSYGFVDSSSSNNTVWGTRQTGGSSGGPELVNLGILASLSGTSVGSAADMNTVVGVTSWGYTDNSYKQQGASPFTSSNIVPMVNSICTGDALTTYCKP